MKKNNKQMKVLQISLMNLVMNTAAVETVLKKVIKPALQIRASQQSITASLWPLTAHSNHVMIIVTHGFSKKSFFIIICRSSSTQLFFKTGIIRNFAIFTGKHLSWSLFLIKLWDLRLYRWFLWKLQNFYEQLFYGTLPVAAFVSLILSWDGFY